MAMRVLLWLHHLEAILGSTYLSLMAVRVLLLVLVLSFSLIYSKEFSKDTPILII
jgi:hypothetical protein